MPKAETKGKDEHKLKDMVDKLWLKTKKDFQGIVRRVSPQAKKELELIVENTKKALEKGEEYLKDISQKGINNTKKLSCALQREKLYYELGRTLAKLAKNKWSSNKKADDLLSEIKALDREIKRTKIV